MVHTLMGQTSRMFMDTFILSDFISGIKLGGKVVVVEPSKEHGYIISVENVMYGSKSQLLVVEVAR